jgi:hypothetical protein
MDENLPATSGSPREDSFDIAVRGFNRQQVMEYMTRSSQLLATLEQHLAVARADVHRARSEAEQAQAELARVRTEHAETKPVHEEVSARLSQILRLAAEEADQERATADEDIAKLHAESQAEAERLLTEARLAADADLAEARETGERELAEARSTAEQELGGAREEADRLRIASIQHAEALLDDAQRRAGAVNEVSNQRLETLTATHGEAVLRLGQIRDVLADLLDRDAAAGSLAQVVEAVIAPPGTTPVQVDPPTAPLQQPVSADSVDSSSTSADSELDDADDSYQPVGSTNDVDADGTPSDGKPALRTVTTGDLDLDAGIGSGVKDATASEPEIDLRDPRHPVPTGDPSRR